MMKHGVTFVAAALALSMNLGVLGQVSIGYEALIEHGKAQLQARRADQALATGEQAIKLNPKNWEGYALAGGALMKLRSYNDAIDRLTDAIERAPQDRQAVLRELRKQCFVAESGSSPPAGTPSMPAANPPAPEATTTQAEIVLWKSVESSTNAGDFQSYLSQYPQGAFAVLAKRHLDELAWKSVEGSRNPADFQSYLAQFPYGEFAVIARSHMNSLKAWAAVGAIFQDQLAWLTQQVAANSKTQFRFRYHVRGTSPDINSPAGKLGTSIQSIAGLQNCVLDINQHVEKPGGSGTYPDQIDNSVHVPFGQLDLSQIHTVDVTDNRTVNGYGGLNGWLIILPAVAGTKPIAFSQQERYGKHFNESTSGGGNWPNYLLVVNDATAAAKAVDLLRQIAQACKAADSGAAETNTSASPGAAEVQSATTTPTPSQSQ